MVHIVQVLLSGCAEAPQAFFDETAARSAYVAGAKKYWAQSYAAFCERSGLESDAFAAAQAFVAGFDLAERSRIHYWTVTPEDGAGCQPTGLEALKGQGANIEGMVRDLEKASAAVREGLNALLATIDDLTEDVTVVAASPGGEPDLPRPPVTAEPTAAPAPAAAPQPAAETHNSKEWQDYVETIKNMCGGNRSEYHLFTRQDWRQAVYSNQTAFEYWQWVAATIDDHIERAQQAGYGVEPAADLPGHYRYRTPDGVVSDSISNAEGEAWCRAGLHLDGKG